MLNSLDSQVYLCRSTGKKGSYARDNTGVMRKFETGAIWDIHTNILR
jgi:hypothetical protein